jgi:hypothetical protein
VCAALDVTPGLLQHRLTMPEGTDMIELSDRDTGTLIATIDEDTFEQLSRSLASEHGDDRDWWIEAGTLSVLANAGVDHGLLKVLGAALGEREGMEVAWKRPA